MSGIDKVVDFKDFLRPNKEIKYFSRSYNTDSRTILLRLLLKLLYEPCHFNSEKGFSSSCNFSLFQITKSPVLEFICKVFLSACFCISFLFFSYAI